MFQTGSPYGLKLMGWLETGDDRALEKILHISILNSVNIESGLFLGYVEYLKKFNCIQLTAILQLTIMLLKLNPMTAMVCLSMLVHGSGQVSNSRTFVPSAVGVVV